MSVKSSWLAWSAAFASGACILFAVFWVVPQRAPEVLPTVHDRKKTRELFERIVPGMTIKSVEELLGTTAMENDIPEAFIALNLLGGGVLSREGNLTFWWMEDSIIQIGFDGEGIVLWKRY